jgi:type I restriction enzyme M protein
MDEYGVIGKLWGFCNILRHDGIGYGDYIEQLTYLLFLKLTEERGVKIPKDYNWQSLKKRSGTELREHYQKVLSRLADEKGLLGNIFAGSLNRFREPVNLKRLITMIDEIQWSETDVDIKAAAYEGLLQKYAEEQKGAGQYFTPREVIRSVIRCMKPDLREKADFSIHDPACGTGGFLIGAYEWMLGQTIMGADLTRDENERLRTRTFSGQEIVLETRRLAFMNLYLHEIETEIEYGDSLSEGPHTGKRYDCILTNPPFGRTGSGRVERADFAVQTSNKQLNFMQHVMTILKPGGRAAMVVPDNVLFESGAGQEIRKILLEDCNLHTILKLPIGTFTPYSPGVRANVIFFTKGTTTKEVWIYDLRTNIQKITKSNPITSRVFEEFEKYYGTSPNAEDKRSEIERFKKFTRKQIEEREINLDITWLRDESLGDKENLPEPDEILVDIETALQSASDLVSELRNLISNEKERGS